MPIIQNRLDLDNEVNLNYVSFMKEGVEDVETLFESLGYPFLDKITRSDFGNLDQHLPDFIEYLCVQYFRTANMKQNVNGLGEGIINYQKIWSVYHLALAFKVADFLLGKGLNVQILNNSSDTRFITGAQPVINLCASKGIMPTCIKYYYPISPQIAVVIWPEEGTPKKWTYNLSSVSSGEVEEYNRQMARFSNSLFAYAEDDLIAFSLG